MSRNGSGTYNLPAGNPVVTGTVISSTWANNTLADMATAITGSIAADGQTPITGALTGTSGTVAFAGVGQTRIPSGTTAQRSASPQDGMIRYNTDLEQYEGYKNGAWSIFGNGAGGTLFSDTITATQGQTVINLPTGYVQGGDNLSVYVNGSRQIYNVNYTETTTSSFTFSTGLNAGDLVNYTIGASTSLSVNASSVLYNEGSTNAVNRNAEQKFQESVSVKDFGALGDGTTDDTDAIQNAIDSGEDLFFPNGSYLCNNLTQSTNGQCFHANGDVKLIKNANGAILTSSGNNVLFENIKFYGDAASPSYTGNNLVSSGNSLSLINCGSQWAYGRAVLATGGHVQIIGSNAIYQTADSTATGFDIEIGVSGTATLYHQLIGVYTSQATGGIKFTDTGSAVINGGQFGKLSILAGTSPAGVNGGITSNCRILGNVTVGLSTSVFTGNQFSTQTITFNAGTSNHYLDTSNAFSNATIINNGNGNGPIIKSIGTGSPSGIILQYGSDSSNCQIRYVEDTVELLNADLLLANNNNVQIANAAGTYQNAITLSSGNDWTIASDTGAGNFTNIISGDGGIYLAPSGTSAFQAIASTFRPQVDGVPSLGTASQRWSVVYATTGTINTSDGTQKQQIRNLNQAEKEAAQGIKLSLKAFKFNDAVEKKGDKARIHFGVIAQEVKEIFAVVGLNAEDYGLFCSDTLEDGTERLGVRYDELLAFVISAL